MRNEIRKLIKESLYDSMERDLTLPSGKVLPNFRGVLLMLISRDADFAKQAIAVISDIKPYEIYKDPFSILETKVTDYYNFYSVNIYVNDKEIADAFEKAITNHPEYNPPSLPLYQGTGFLDNCRTGSASFKPGGWHKVVWNVDKKVTE